MILGRVWLLSVSANYDYLPVELFLFMGLPASWTALCRYSVNGSLASLAVLIISG